jgi:ceramide synthetase
MAAKKPKEKSDTIVIDPATNNVFTGLFFVEIAVAVYVSVTKNDMEGLYYLIACCIGVAFLIVFVKESTRFVGKFVSRTLLSGFGDPLAKERTMQKFVDQSWQLVIHVAMTSLELYILSTENWYSDTTLLWIPKPAQQLMDGIRWEVKALYCIQTAIWIVTCLSHRFFEEHHKDYYVMYAHHLATILLILLSYQNNYVRLGTLVLLVHDLSDIPVDVLKMVNYCKLEDMKGFFASEIAFILNLASWLYLRLYILPYRVMYSAWFESRKFATQNNTPPSAGWHKDGTFDQVESFIGNFFMDDLPMYWPNCLLLTLLFFMHIYWYLLFLRILMKIIRGSAHEAGKEEYEGGSDDEDDDKNQ